MTLIYAHRGASKHAPENTRSSFELAVQLNSDGLETDVQLTKDKEVVIIHDPTLDRTTESYGKVKDYTLEELQMIKNGQWFDPSFASDTLFSLQQLIDWWKDTDLYLNIELKSHRYNDQAIVEKTLKGLSTIQHTEKLILSSFDIEYLKKVRLLNPSITTGFLTKKRLSINELSKHKSYIDGIHLHYKAYTKDFLKIAHQFGYYVHLYTVNDATLFKRYVTDGVDGLITDDLKLPMR